MRIGDWSSVCCSSDLPNVDRRVARGLLRGGVEAESPVALEFEAKACADSVANSRYRDRRRALPIIRSDVDPPSGLAARGARADLEASPGEAEDAHAGGILARHERIVPAGTAEGEEHRRVFDAGAVVGDAEPGSPIVLAGGEFE